MQANNYDNITHIHQLKVDVCKREIAGLIVYANNPEICDGERKIYEGLITYHRTKLEGAVSDLARIVMKLDKGENLYI
jgi:hypothetical protein